MSMDNFKADLEALIMLSTRTVAAGVRARTKAERDRAGVMEEEMRTAMNDFASKWGPL